MAPSPDPARSEYEWLGAHAAKHALAPRIQWPDGKSFAFSIFDDTDGATVQNVAPVYDHLSTLGFRTTKSVWPMGGKSQLSETGDTCENPQYLDWILELQLQGFEIGYHMSTFHTSSREETLRGLNQFEFLFGHPPATMANHSRCAENIYWGAYRVSGINRVWYNLATRFRRVTAFRGHLDRDPLFWGDLCKARIKYCRNFTFTGINTLRACPFMPYHDPERPYVNYWFASSEGPWIGRFLDLLSESHQDQLEAEGGACIVYTHFASGFNDGGAPNRRFRELMERLVKKNGWFVPVATLLDYILEFRGPYTISPQERVRLERRWLLHRFRAGST